jgi:hypothetical protein
MPLRAWQASGRDLIGQDAAKCLTSAAVRREAPTSPLDNRGEVAGQ